MMTKRACERGTTLTEILLALIVLVLGVMGILALFPTALQQATESMEDTVTGNVSQSLSEAMVVAMKYATYDSVAGTSASATFNRIESARTSPKSIISVP